MTEILPEEYDSIEFPNNFPLASNMRSNTFNQQSLREQRNHKPAQNCEFCSKEFFTVTELNAHRQQECDLLIEMESNRANYKPSAVDLTESESDMETRENQATDDVDDDSSDVVDEKSTNSECITNRHGQKKCDRIAAATKKTYNREKCDRPFRFHSKLEKLDVMHSSTNNGQFECELCKRL